MIAVVSRPLCRNSFNTSSPFLTGISISRITSSGASFSNLSRHSRPLAAGPTREPRLSRVSLRMSRISASSSAIRMLPLRVFIDSVSPGFLLHPRPFQGEGKGEGHSEPRRFVRAQPPCSATHHGSKSAAHDNPVLPRTDSVYDPLRPPLRVGHRPTPPLTFFADNKSQQRMGRRDVVVET